MGRLWTRFVTVGVPSATATRWSPTPSLALERLGLDHTPAMEPYNVDLQCRALMEAGVTFP